jgi:hypothetical protein
VASDRFGNRGGLREHGLGRVFCDPRAGRDLAGSYDSAVDAHDVAALGDDCAVECDVGFAAGDIVAGGYAARY